MGRKIKQLVAFLLSFLIIIATFPLLTSAQAVSSYSVKYNITYDTSDNPLTSVVSSSDGSTDTITSSMTYQDNGNFPYAVTIH